MVINYCSLHFTAITVVYFDFVTTWWCTVCVLISNTWIPDYWVWFVCVVGVCLWVGVWECGSVLVCVSVCLGQIFQFC